MKRRNEAIYTSIFLLLCIVIPALALPAARSLDLVQLTAPFRVVVYLVNLQAVDSLFLSE